MPLDCHQLSTFGTHRRNALRRGVALGILIALGGCELFIDLEEPDDDVEPDIPTTERFRIDSLECFGRSDTMQRRRPGTSIMLASGGSDRSAGTVFADLDIQGELNLVVATDIGTLWIIDTPPGSVINTLVTSGPNQVVETNAPVLQQFDLNFGTTTRFPREVGDPNADVVIGAQELVGELSMFIGCPQISSLRVSET